MSKKLKGNLMLLLTSIIWGSAFVAQSMGGDHLGPLAFNGVRNIIAGLFLLAVIPFLKNKSQEQNENSGDKKTLIIGGIVCGLALFVAGYFQQKGVQYTTAGKAGFITTLYVVIVPIIGLFLGKKVSKKVWFCVVLAAIGLYYLSIKPGSFDIGFGDMLIAICAIFFSLHILVIDHFSPKVDGVKMSCIQFFVCGAANLFAMLFFETFELSEVIEAMVPILYAAIMSSGVGYTLQIIAQKDTDPTIASLILSLESVFAVLAGMLLLSETLSIREVLGCVLIFLAIIIAQLPEKQTASA